MPRSAPVHLAQRQDAVIHKTSDVRRDYHYLYGRKWRKARKLFLVKNPLCVDHVADNRVVSASVVDHKTPHRGCVDLFWDVTNWQALCKPCHDRKTANEVGLSGGGGSKVQHP